MGVEIVLFGTCGQQDNLALGYLASYVESHGHSASIISFEHRREIPRCVEAVRRLNPALIGLGISFQFAISEYLSLAAALRAAGYQGHITCGGHVPTFCYRELLETSTAIDTAVRHEGEQTLLEMLNSIEQKKPLRDIDGLVWREPDEIIAGPPRPLIRNLDTLPWPKRLSSTFRIAGFSVQFVIASRGCVGDCAYCVIRAFNKDAGGPAFRMRHIKEVATEIASLRKNTGARLVMMQDDLFIMPAIQKSIDRMNQLRQELSALGVYDLQFWIKARPETITAPLLDAARALGVGQIFLGIEQVSKARLEYLGRSHSPEDNRNALDLMIAYGIQPCFNLMMFDPDCTIAEVDAAIAFGREYAHVPWNICRTEMYPGTAIHDRLHEQGRLEGDFIHCGYAMTDPASELMFRIMRVAFYHRSFNIDSLTNRLSTLLFALEAAYRLSPTPEVPDELQRGRVLLRTVNLDTAKRLQAASNFAKSATGAAPKTVQTFAMNLSMDMNETDHGWHQEIEALFDALHQRQRDQAQAG